MPFPPAFASREGAGWLVAFVARLPLEFLFFFLPFAEFPFLGFAGEESSEESEPVAVACFCRDSLCLSSTIGPVPMSLILEADLMEVQYMEICLSTSRPQ